MKRKEFLQKSLKAGLCCSGLLAGIGMGTDSIFAQDKTDIQDSPIKQEKEFIENWLTDLLSTMEKELDEETRIKLIEGCGKGCFRRHKFKTDIAERGKGSVDKLIEAMKNNFEVWRDGNKVHIRYGESNPQCYCVVLKNSPKHPNALHCNCTKATHQAIFETALGRPVKVDILESHRRGGKTCHFLVHL